MSRERNLAYIADVTAAVDVPVSADFMSGYGTEPEDVAESVTRCVATGVAGLSIEDATGDSSSPLYDLPIAVERIRAARQAIDRSGGDVLLTPEPSVTTSAILIRSARAFDARADRDDSRRDKPSNGVAGVSTEKNA